MKPIYRTFLAFSLSLIVGLALRSQDLFAVDGGRRCLTIFRQPTLHFHPNNHLLYLVNVLVWTKLAAHLGFQLSEPLRFVLVVDTMNCVAAAGCIGILFWFLCRVTSSWKLAAGVCMAYGLTAAFLTQAVNPNEPMVGACWSLLALCFVIVSARNQRLWPLLIAGLLFALAMATYRTMVLLGPAAAVLLVTVPAKEKTSGQSRVVRLLLFGTAFALFCALIHGWAYSRMGVPPHAMLSKFLHQEDTSVYFDPSPLQWLRLPLGLVRNFFPILPVFNGIRGVLQEPAPVLVAVAVLVGTVWFCVVYVGYTLWRQRNALNSIERSAVLGALTGLFFTMIPLITWNPYYGKFFIQPLACLATLVAVAFRHFSLISPRIPAVARIAGLIFLAGLSSNLVSAARDHAHQPFEFEEARKVTQYVSDKDFVVLDWDSVSEMYSYLWADEKHFVSFIDLGCLQGMGAVRDLDRTLANVRASGGKVYFLGIIDLPKPIWDSFLGARCKVPYGTIDSYRAAVHAKAQFHSRSGVTYLYELQLPALTDPEIRQSH